MDTGTAPGLGSAAPAPSRAPSPATAVLPPPPPPRPDPPFPSIAEPCERREVAGKLPEDAFLPQPKAPRARRAQPAAAACSAVGTAPSQPRSCKQASNHREKTAWAAEPPHAPAAEAESVAERSAAAGEARYLGAGGSCPWPSGAAGASGSAARRAAWHRPHARPARAPPPRPAPRHRRAAGCGLRGARRRSARSAGPAWARPRTPQGGCTCRPASRDAGLCNAGTNTRWFVVESCWSPPCRAGHVNHLLGTLRWHPCSTTQNTSLLLHARRFPQVMCVLHKVRGKPPDHNTQTGEVRGITSLYHVSQT